MSICLLVTGCIISCVFIALSSTSYAAMMEQTKISSPTRSFLEQPPAVANCTIWKYDGGFWPPQGHGSIVGPCRCARGSGCHCWVQGCGEYERYNTWFEVESWFLICIIVMSSVSALLLGMLAIIFSASSFDKT